MTNVSTISQKGPKNAFLESNREITQDTQDKTTKNLQERNYVISDGYRKLNDLTGYDESQNYNYIDNSNQGKQLYQMPIPMINQSHINGPIQKRIQTINEEVQRQRQNLPQFKNLNSKVKQIKNCLINVPASQAMNYDIQNSNVQFKSGKNNKQAEKYIFNQFHGEQFNNGSQAVFENNGESIQYVNENQQEEQMSYQRPIPVSRGGVSTNDQSFYMLTHASPRNNFKENLQLLQQQQLLQMSLLEKAQQSQSFSIKKKKFKPIVDDSQTNYKKLYYHQPSNVVLYDGSDQYFNDFKQQSAIGVLRNASIGRPQMDTYNHDYHIQKYAHNFNNHNKLQRNNFAQGSMGINNQSQAKIDDIRNQKSPIQKKKRRLINAQNDGVQSQFDYIQENKNIAYQMTKSATDFNKNARQLDGTQQFNNYKEQSIITTPILKNGKNDNTIVFSEQMDNYQMNNLFDQNGQQKQGGRAITQMVYSTEDLRKIQNNQSIIKNYVRIQEEEYAKKGVKGILQQKKTQQQNLRSPIPVYQQNTYDISSSGVDNIIQLTDTKNNDKKLTSYNKQNTQKYIQQNQEDINPLTQTPDSTFQKGSQIQTGAKYIDYINGVPLEVYIQKDIQSQGVVSPQLKVMKTQILPGGYKLPSIQKSIKTQKKSLNQDIRISSGNQNKSLKKPIQESNSKVNGLQQNDLSSRKVLKNRKFDSISKKELSPKKKITNYNDYQTQKQKNQYKSELKLQRGNHDIVNEEEENINNIEIPEVIQEKRKESFNKQKSCRNSQISRNDPPQTTDRKSNKTQQKGTLTPKRIKKSSKKDQTQSRSQSLNKKGHQHSSKQRHDDHSKGKRTISNKRNSGKRHPINNLYKYDPKFFNKINPIPPLFQIDVDKEDYFHLMNDDLNEVSKLEVTYKILKQQLREHQKKLIEAKEEQKRQKLQVKMLKKRQRSNSTAHIDLNRFARHIKHYELYGSQRDLSPEIKRIVKNLMCQEHKFMYCPCCKTYDIEDDFDPIENIQKFMDYIRAEQNKLRKKKNFAVENRKFKKKNKEKKLADDSASDITYLEQDEILAKYIDENMSLAQRKMKERLETQKRLYGENNLKKHNCQDQKRARSARHVKTVKMELREVEDPKSMYDQSNSAHQFSKRNMSVQADSEARMDFQMQTSVIDFKSMINQTSKQDAQSVVNQTSEVDKLSNHMQTSMFGPNAPYNHFGVQTDPKFTRGRTPIRKSKQNQTEKLKDMYKDDWKESSVYKKAMKNEAIKRNISFDRLYISEDEEESEKEDEDTAGMVAMNYQEQNQEAVNTTSQNTDDEQENIADIQNAQDPDTDHNIHKNNKQKTQQFQSGIGFLKNYKMKGNIKMLTESELQYVKKLLKQKNHHFWKEPSTLNDLHRHCKYTIRKLTQKMANIDNYQVFKHLKDPTREHTLYLVYRAERLFSALTETEKIFQLVSQTILDNDKFNSIIENKSIKKDDQKFIKQRELIFRRIMTQINTFNETYKLFADFNFQGQPLREYLANQLDKVTICKLGMEEIRQANPEMAAKEDEKLKEEERDKQQKKIAMRNYLIELGNQYNYDKENTFNTPDEVLNTSRDEINTSHQLLQSEAKHQLTDFNQQYQISETKQSIEIQSILDQNQNFKQSIKMVSQVNQSLQFQESVKQVPLFNQNRNQSIQKSQEAQQLQNVFKIEEKKNKEISLNMNKYNEQEIVGMNTIQIINDQVEQEDKIQEKQQQLFQTQTLEEKKIDTQVNVQKLGGDDFRIKLGTPKLQESEQNLKIKNETKEYNKPGRRLSAMTNSTIAADKKILRESQIIEEIIQKKQEIKQNIFIGYSEEKRLKLVTGKFKIELEKKANDGMSSQIETPRLNGKQVEEFKINEDIYSD